MGGPTVANLDANEDQLVATLGPTGQFQWQRTFADAACVATGGPKGEVVLATSSNLDLGGGPLLPQGGMAFARLAP